MRTILTLATAGLTCAFLASTSGAMGSSPAPEKTAAAAPVADAAVPAQAVPAAPAQNNSLKMLSATPPAGALDPSLQNEVRQAIDRSLTWLAAQQREDGSWSDTNFPALTALPLQAFTASDMKNRQVVIDKAVKFILSCVQTNGGIYKEIPGRKGGGLSNYNTGIAMMGLYSTGDQALNKVILNARKFVAGAQYFGDDDYSGGFGYDKDTQRAYTDVLNTYYTVEAMKATAGLEDARDKTEKKVDINWDETVKYIARMQNKPNTGDQAGGLYYNPTDPKAGTVTNANGKVIFRSYGSITYAGMLALIHANVSRDDVRVKSAYDWATKHWSIEENPGMGQNAILFFYNVLTKSLAAYGQDMIQDKDGKLINWKAEVAKKLVSIQTVDANGQGYWENKTGRYWENDKVLSTAYCVIALEKLMK